MTTKITRGLLCFLIAVGLMGAAARPVRAESSTPRQGSVSTQLAGARELSSHFLLDHLTVGSTYHAGYVRSKFRLWSSHPNGCNTRYQVLIRDAVRKPTVEAGCYLAHGKWVSPYDGYTTTDPTKIQIDHVVPLAVAWGSGAWHWTSATRERYANDLGTRYELLAVSAHANESKGDDGPDQYLPPKTSFDCRYMADYTGVLWRWRLHISTTEKGFLTRHLRACGWPTVREPSRPKIHTGSSKPGGSGRHTCTLTSTGHCIKAGEFCPAADNGQTGYDGSGTPLVCKHGHWEHP